MHARPTASGCCASKTSMRRAHAKAQPMPSCRRSNASVSSGKARSGDNRNARNAMPNALERLRARNLVYPCACTRARACARLDRPHRRTDLSGHLPRRGSTRTARRAVGRRFACAFRQTRSRSPIDCRDRSGRCWRMTSAISSSAAPTGCSRTSWRSSSTMPRRRSPTSCAAPIFSRRRRARSSCSTRSACRRRAICTCRSHRRAWPQAVEADGRALAAGGSAAGAARRVAFPRPARSARNAVLRRGILVLGARALAAVATASRRHAACV